jgi:hypothetical protein
MSGKSKRRGRHLSRSQRKKLGHDVSPIRPAPATPTPAAPTTPVAAKAEPAPKAAAPAPAPETKAAARALAPVSDVAGELKRIGLVGGIMVLLMVVAYFVVPLIVP